MLFSFKPKHKVHSLQDEINDVLSHLEINGVDTPEYEELLKQLERLTALKAFDKDRRVSADTVIAVAGNLAGIAIILGYEHMHAITSKALGFVIKAKV